MAARRSAAPPGEAFSASMIASGAGQGGAPGETGATASRQHLTSALLHGLQPGHTGARQHAGIAQRGHDGHQRIKLRLRLTGASRPAVLQLRQRQAGDMRETTLRFLAGASAPASGGWREALY